MSKTPNFDLKVKDLLDAAKPGEMVCSFSGDKWNMTQEDIDRFRKFNVPPLVVSPSTFFKLWGQILSGYSWWWNKDADTGKPLLTHIHPHFPWKVLPDDEWHQRDFSEINQVVDPSSPILDQIYDLMLKVPMSSFKNIEKPINSISRISLGDENSIFTEGTRSKNCLYSTDSIDIENSSEVNWSHRVQRSYNTMMCSDLSGCKVARNSRDCIDCEFVFDCWNCEFCFMSSGQRHKKYMWHDEQLAKQEWEKKRSEIDLGEYEVFEKLYKEFQANLSSKYIWPENFNVKAENSVGEYLTNCVNCDTCWYAEGAKDCWWSAWGNLGTEDCSLGCDPGGSRCFGDMIAISSSDCRYGRSLRSCHACEYSVECFECEYCFGCVGLKRKKFHIFNKEYSEEEYWKKLDEIKSTMLDRGEYGMPFYGKFAPTPYHAAGGFVFQDIQPEDYEKFGIVDFDGSLDGAYGDWEGKELRSVSEIPDNIKDVSDDFKGAAFLDEETGRPFTLFGPEIEFYRKMNIRVPKTHFIKRVFDVWGEMNLFDFEDRNCKKCDKLVNVAKNRKYPNRKIYCKECYLTYLENR